jgi:dTDP-4-dehydrorhamnose 3,5-epimerase-like enzyme
MQPSGASRPVSHLRERFEFHGGNAASEIGDNSAQSSARFFGGGPRRYDPLVTDGSSVARDEQAPPSASKADRCAAPPFDDVTSVPLAHNAEERGRLLELDFGALPFTVRRVFVVTDVPAETTRGGHRHLSGAQVLVCISGRIEVDLRRGAARTAVTLTPDTDGLCIPAGIWSAQRYVEEGSALVVLASEPFDPANYETSF